MLIPFCLQVSEPKFKFCFSLMFPFPFPRRLVILPSPLPLTLHLHSKLLESADSLLCYVPFWALEVYRYVLWSSQTPLNYIANSHSHYSCYSLFHHEISSYISLKFFAFVIAAFYFILPIRHLLPGDNYFSKSVLIYVFGKVYTCFNNGLGSGLPQPISFKLSGITNWYVGVSFWFNISQIFPSFTYLVFKTFNFTYLLFKTMALLPAILRKHTLGFLGSYIRFHLVFVWHLYR